MVGCLYTIVVAFGLAVFVETLSQFLEQSGLLSPSTNPNVLDLVTPIGNSLNNKALHLLHDSGTGYRHVRPNSESHWFQSYRVTPDLELPWRKDRNSRFNEQSTETSSDGPDREGPLSFEDIAKCVTRTRKAGSSVSITAANVEAEDTPPQSANDCDFDEMKYKQETLAEAEASASAPKSKSQAQTASKGPGPGDGKPKDTTAVESYKDKAPLESLTTVQKWM
ncbi:MAG: hypothetical protein Q9178_006638 [Gyalolechia marmorata]